MVVVKFKNQNIIFKNWKIIVFKIGWVKKKFFFFYQLIIKLSKYDF